MVEYIPNDLDKNCLIVARGITGILSNQPFHIMVFNTLNVSVTLWKNMTMAKIDFLQYNYRKHHYELCRYAKSQKSVP